LPAQLEVLVTVLKILSFGSKRTREEPYAEPAFPDQQYGDPGYADPGYPEQHYLEQQQPYPDQPYADQGGPYPPQQWHNGHPQPGTALELANGIGEEPLDAEGWLAVHHVKKSYKKRMVVRGVSLAVARGESVGLLGPNGAGKTTVFYMITGLVPADEGAISIDGADVTRLPMYRRARLGIGYLPQEASIFRGLTVEQNIMAVLEIVESSAKQRRIKLDSLLDEFRITHLRKSPSIALSGGERRRCEIARALASGPSFMLLDEPFAGIDPIAVLDIQTIVRRLREFGIGILVTDHNVRETLKITDRAYIINNGEILRAGVPAELSADPEVRKIYLGEDFRL
jgi:lipopolysaccharide export system ATP-binding protein